MGVIFLMEIGAGIAAYKLKGQEKYEGVTQTWDVLQRELRCCGTQEYMDWVNTTISSGENVPDSCCLSTVIGCGLGVLSLAPEKAAMKIHTEGCLDIFSEQIASNIGGVGGVGIGIGLVQLIGMIFAIFLATTIKKQYESV